MTTPDKLPPVRSLACCCCGDSTRGRQWHNRDTGFGLCVRCIPLCERGETPDSFKRLYGVRGYHFALPSDPSEALALLLDAVGAIRKAGDAFNGSDVQTALVLASGLRAVPPAHEPRLDLSDTGPYATAEDTETAAECGLTVEQLRRDRYADDLESWRADHAR